jgi:hypothetical protein
VYCGGHNRCVRLSGCSYVVYAARAEPGLRVLDAKDISIISSYESCLDQTLGSCGLWMDIRSLREYDIWASQNGS